MNTKVKIAQAGPIEDIALAIFEAKRVIGALLTPGERFPTCSQLNSAWTALQRVDLAQMTDRNVYGK